MADYSINPQFANLSGLQPLPALDLTRGGSLQFQALQPIQVVSSQPELVAQGIAGAVQGVAQGALSGITAKWQKEEDLAKEQRKYAHEIELASAKKKSEDLDFAQKELLKFDIAHSGDADYQERRKQVEEALYGRVRDVTPQKEPSESVKKAQEESEKEYKTSEDPRYKKTLSEAQDGDLKKEIQKIDAQIPLPEMEGVGEAPKDEKTVAVYTPSETPTLISDKPVSLSLSGLQPQVQPQAQQTVPTLAEVKIPVDETTSVSTKVAETTPSTPPKVDVVPLPQPDYPANPFKSREQAEEARKTIDTNKHWEFKVSDKPDSRGYFYIEPISKFETVTNRQRQERDDWYKQQDLELKKQKAQQDIQAAEEKSGKITKANVSQFKFQVDQAAASVREINDLIKLIQENPNTAVGGWSMPLLLWPGNNAAKQSRGMLKTVHSNVAFNALMELKKASPTGAAGTGSLTEGEREALASTEGSFDFDNLPSEYIIPRLKLLRDARLKLISIASKEIEQVDPKFKKPELEYPKIQKTSKKQKPEQVEKVSVISPDGKVGTIPKSQLEEAISKGYKLQ